MSATEDTPAPGRRPPGDPHPPLVRLRGVGKRYGRTQALDGADLEVRPSEVLGLIGHNGAGKSTLTRVVLGLTAPDTGSVELAGRPAPRNYRLPDSRAAGIRIVFQELSLCPTLRVFEGVLVAHPGLSGRGWRARAKEAVAAQLDEIFPGHGIDPRSRVESLSLGRRQMVEIAQAALGDGARLLILDEPTSALGPRATEQLFAFLRRRRDRGGSCLLITHKMPEILGHTDRIVVMRDGRTVAELPSAEADEDRLVALMGNQAAAVPPPSRRPSAAAARREPVVRTESLTTRTLRRVTVQAAPGEVVGLAGLDGQGQQDLLLAVWRRRSGRHRGVAVRGRTAFVTGDRAAAGVFPLWPVSLNISIGALDGVSRFGAVDLAAERRQAREWVQRLGVRGTAESPILSLSGGTQQKALLARALASSADLVLLDDPFRGVDFATKQDTYRLLREEADGGRCFLWFTTENSELQQCDRVYVLHEGAVAAELAGEEITEERVISASFAGTEERPA